MPPVVTARPLEGPAAELDEATVVPVQQTSHGESISWTLRPPSETMHVHAGKFVCFFRFVPGRYFRPTHVELGLRDLGWRRI